MKVCKIITLILSASSVGAMQKLITPITLSKKLEMSKDGRFASSQAAQLFFNQAAVKLALPRALSAKIMSKEAQAAKFATAQLVKLKCEDGNSYILKEIKGAKEAKKEIPRLERVRSSKRIQPYTDAKDGLQINVPLVYVSYRYKDKEHILVIMRKAKGLSLQDLLVQFKKNPHDRKIHKILAKAYYDLGAALARFYKMHGSLNSTIVHGDLHAGNIFYKEGEGVTFIDNETLAKSLDTPRSISVDLGYLFITSPFVMEWAEGGFLKQFDAKKWYTLVLPSFILGFIRTYSQEERIGCFTTLKNHIFTWDCKINRDQSRPLRAQIKEQLLILEKQLVTEKKTALHIAAAYSAMTPVLKRMIFVEQSTAVAKKDKDGNRALHEAAYFGNMENVYVLLKANPTMVDAKNKKKETPVYKAIYQRNNSKDPGRYQRIIEILTTNKYS